VHLECYREHRCCRYWQYQQDIMQAQTGGTDHSADDEVFTKAPTDILTSKSSPPINDHEKAQYLRVGELFTTPIPTGVSAKKSGLAVMGSRAPR
jgi:hypothetical protein